MSMQFVDGWSIAEVLGEGSFGEVKLLVNNETREAVAVKVLNTGSCSETKLAVKKEIAIHRPLNHPNIVKYFGHRFEPGLDYIFLEYAAGGELFDRIEPDLGMGSGEAQKYLIELVSAVEYLHERGVTHRDIKPENILLSDSDHIKLSDFGMATMFRKNGTERMLDKKCGTMPYVAPEVLLRPYSAPAADIWSCGVVLVAMLAGELPWDKPSTECLEYVSWRDGNVTASPWCKLDTSVLSLLRKLLSPLPNKRPAACDIYKLRWCRTKPIDPVKTPSMAAGPKRLNSGLEIGSSEENNSNTRLCLTQPLPQVTNTSQTDSSIDNDTKENQHFCFSQPIVLDDLLLSSQLHASQAATLPIYQRLVRRMTRLLVLLSPDSASERLTSVLETLGCSVRCGPPLVITANITDRRKMQLTFKIHLIAMDGGVLLDFRLSKGDGLEFKKLFLKAKTMMADVAIKKPVPWSLINSTTVN